MSYGGEFRQRLTNAYTKKLKKKLRTSKINEKTGKVKMLNYMEG